MGYVRTFFMEQLRGERFAPLPDNALIGGQKKA